jgi:ketosteroid isomerase-like protein
VAIMSQSMDRATMDQMVNDHFMYEATDDIEGVLATLTDDVQHHVVGSPWGPLTGKEAVRPFYEQLFGDLKGKGVEPVARWYGDNFLVDETLWTGHVADGRFFGLPGKSGDVTFRLLHVFEFRDGRISKEEVWSDIVAIAEAIS